jgi:DNA-binding response OmpR family regulator
MSKKYKLLIIEDNQEILAGLYNFLTKRKFEVVTASDGLEGLKMFDTDKEGYDLVITDLVMPNISGIGVITIVKEKYPDTPVIAITGMGEHPEALAIEANADIVIEKPFDLTELENQIAELLGKKE